MPPTAMIDGVHQAPDDVVRAVPHELRVEVGGGEQRTENDEDHDPDDRDLQPERHPRARLRQALHAAPGEAVGGGPGCPGPHLVCRHAAPRHRSVRSGSIRPSLSTVRSSPNHSIENSVNVPSACISSMMPGDRLDERGLVELRGLVDRHRQRLEEQRVAEQRHRPSLVDRRLQRRRRRHHGVDLPGLAAPGWRWSRCRSP